MVVHTIFALVSNNVIKNVCVGDYPNCNTIAHDLYGPDAFAIEVTQYPVQEGDKYIDKEFRRYAEDGTYTVIEYIPTDTQEIESLKGTTETVSTDTTKNANDITDIQVALAEIYESMSSGT